MKKVEVLISENDLHKLKELGIEYEITNPDIELENYLKCSTNIAELSNYEVEQVVQKAKEAIQKGIKYGLVVDVNLGRDMNDERCYSLNKVYISSTKKEDWDFTVKEFLNLLN
jgi:hypothetical protein